MHVYHCALILPLIVMWPRFQEGIKKKKTPNAFATEKTIVSGQMKPELSVFERQEEDKEFEQGN